MIIEEKANERLPVTLKYGYVARRQTWREWLLMWWPAFRRRHEAQQRAIIAEIVADANAPILWR